jgi:hypothetical protein
MTGAVAKLKTAAELCDMVAQRIGLGPLFLAAKSDPYDGWRAYVVTAPQLLEMQMLVELGRVRLPHAPPIA